jgi:Secretion system C-terminal sorting domain
MIEASHEYTLNRIGSNLEWTFDSINLLPITVSETGSQGFVHFKIKPKPGYMVGDIIPNTAQIYFDFNDPIITNTFETEFVTTLANPDFTLENLMIYPNPTSNQVVISVQNSTDTIETIRLMDVLGKVVLQKEVQQNQATLDLSKLSKGVYMVEIKTENQFTVVKKLVKN